MRNGYSLPSRIFDLRVPLDEQKAEWNERCTGQCIDAFFLGKNIEVPLSVDNNVWDQPEVQVEHKEGDSYLKWLLSIMPTSGLWHSLEEFRSGVNELQTLISVNYVVLLMDRGTTENKFQPLPQEAEFLGYDIGDHMLISGLMNCGFRESDWAEFDLEKYVPHLNRWHLFDELESALEFANMSDIRVKEHAPFSVIRMATINVSIPSV